MVDVVFHIVHDKKIELAVAIVIEPGSRGSPVAIITDSGFFRYLCEGAVAVVVP